jgi:hypothetical protein
MSIMLSPGVRTFEHPSGQAVARGAVANRLLAIGMARKGPINTPVAVRTYQQFIDRFGDDLLYGELAVQMRQAFTGLGDAVVVRTANNAVKATLTLQDEFGANTLDLWAVDAGLLGDMIRASVDYDTLDPELTFNLSLWRETRDDQDRIGQAENERFTGLSMDPQAPNFVHRAVNGVSRLVTATAVNAAEILTQDNSARLYSQSGIYFPNAAAIETALGNLGADRQITVEVNGRESVAVNLQQPLTMATLQTAINNALTGRALSARVVVNAHATAHGAVALRISVNSADGARSIRILPGPGNDAAAELGLGSLSGGLEVGLYSEARPAMTGLTTRPFAGGVNDLSPLEDILATVAPVSPWTVDFDDGTPAGSVKGVRWGADGIPNLMHDVAGAEPSLTKLRANLDGMVAALNAAASVGDNWTFARIGNRVRATRDDGNVVPSEAASFAVVGAPGIGYVNNAIAIRPARFLAGGRDGDAPLLADYHIAFGRVRREVDLFNMLILPRGHQQSDADRSVAWGAASAFCREQNALLIMDPLSDNNAWSTVDQVVAQPGLTGFKSGVIPEVTCTFWPRVRVPVGRIQIHVDPSGTMAGVIASTIARLGVWNAAAGLSAPLVGVLGLEHPMSEADNGVINPRGINALRAKSTGNVSWGVRSLAGDDAFSNRDFAYIPVRMTTDFIKNSLSAGLQDFVFKPNNYVTWASIEMMCRGFMHGLYERKAFAGRSVEDAYQIRIDETTTSPSDIALGIMNVWVFFAPLFPAEFIHLHVQHIFQRPSA